MLAELPANSYPTWRSSVPLFEMDDDFNPYKYSGNLIESWKIKYGQYIPEFLGYITHYRTFDVFVNWNAYDDRNPNEWSQTLLVVSVDGVGFESSAIEWENFRVWQVDETEIITNIASQFIDGYLEREAETDRISTNMSWYIRDNFGSSGKAADRPNRFSTDNLKIYVEERRTNQRLIDRALSRIRRQFFNNF